MLWNPPVIPQVYQTNITPGSGGTTVTASGTADTKGSYTSLINSLDHEVYGLWIRVRNVAASATVTSMLMDFAEADSGGGSETVVIPNVNMGEASLVSGSPGKVCYFPARFAAGTRIAARCQAAISSDTALVAIWASQLAPYPWAVGSIVDYGTDLTDSSGTSVTTGNAVFGSWTSLGTTDEDHTYWALMYDTLQDTTVAAAFLNYELGVGPNSSNVTTILRGVWGQDVSENVYGPVPTYGHAPVPSGTEIWVRIGSNEAAARSVIAYGMR